MTETQAPARAATPAEGRRHVATPHEIPGVRDTDLEPYIGLRYLSKLFRLMAVILILLLIAESATGLMQQGSAALPTLLAEASRLVVFAGLLWGAGDLAILLIDMGHDVRATRILLARQLAHHMAAHHDARGTDAGDTPGRHAHAAQPVDVVSAPPR